MPFSVGMILLGARAFYSEIGPPFCRFCTENYSAGRLSWAEVRVFSEVKVPGTEETSGENSVKEVWHEIYKNAGVRQ